MAAGEGRQRGAVALLAFPFDGYGNAADKAT
jgi:hypothetical protein